MIACCFSWLTHGISSCMVLVAVLFHVTVEAQHNAFIKLFFHRGPRTINTRSDIEQFSVGVKVMERKRFDAVVVPAPLTLSALVLYTFYLTEIGTVNLLSGKSCAVGFGSLTTSLIPTLIATIAIIWLPFV
jgi:hypothetical protein